MSKRPVNGAVHVDTSGSYLCTATREEYMASRDEEPVHFVQSERARVAE